MHLELPRNRRLVLDRPRLVGVLNVTPDSFSDGGAWLEPDAATAQARRMLDEGADVIDVGGESTRPGAARVDVEAQLDRVLPVIERLAGELDAVISIDTTRPAVARAALDAGAAMLNDVSAGRDDPAMFDLAAQTGAPLVLMHMQGEPATMQTDPRYDDVVAEVRTFLLQRAAAAEAAGVQRSRIVLDPGIGFGKTTQHNLQLIVHLDRLVDTGYAVLLGASRKRFLGELTGVQAADQRGPATAATTAAGVLAGVHLFRVHDLTVNRHVADVTHAVAAHRRQHG